MCIIYTMSPKKNNTRRRSGNTLTQLYVNQKEQQDRIKDSVRLIDSLKENRFFVIVQYLRY